MHYPDLDTECQIARGPCVRAVGWLASGHEFGRGDVDKSVVEALTRLADEGWIHVAAGGGHECEFCRTCRDGRNILVPADDLLYVAPAMVTHYIADHSYRPPTEFCEAVLSCPVPTTDAYYAALARFIELFGPPGRPMKARDFDRCAREHRDRIAARASARAADAARKRFTWD